MANVIYVGNYPTAYTDDDVMDIFQDFEGLVLLRSIKKLKKCYCFILCLDQEQVLEIVLTLNGADVDGRTLIVRASDEELQDIIDECDLEDEYYSEEDQLEANQQNGCSASHSSLLDMNSSFNSSSGNNPNPHRQPRNPSRLVLGNEPSNSKYSQNGDFQVSDSRKTNLSTHNKPNHKYSSKYEKDTYSASYDTKEDRYPNSETASCASSVYNDRTSPGSTTSRFSKSDRRGERFSFVSVINFRNGTTLEELKELFSDYNPYKIIIKCATSPKRDIPTEALVCFLKSKNATNSIMNLDNTLHKGRVLLVMECDDMSYISELIDIKSL